MQQLQSYVQAIRQPEAPPKALQCTTVHQRTSTNDRWQEKKTKKSSDVNEQQQQYHQVKDCTERSRGNMDIKPYKQR